MPPGMAVPPNIPPTMPKCTTLLMTEASYVACIAAAKDDKAKICKCYQNSKNKCATDCCEMRTAMDVGNCKVSCSNKCAGTN